MLFLKRFLDLRTAVEVAFLLAISLTLGLLHHMWRFGGLPGPREYNPVALAEQELKIRLEVSLEEALEWHRQGRAVFLDARYPPDFEKGHIKGARNIPIEELDVRLEKSLKDIPPGMSIVAYCDGIACSLSKELALGLIMRGHDNVRVLVNGWSRWVDAGGPIETGPDQ